MPRRSEYIIVAKAVGKCPLLWKCPCTLGYIKLHAELFPTWGKSTSGVLILIRGVLREGDHTSQLHAAISAIMWFEKVRRGSMCLKTAQPSDVELEFSVIIHMLLPQILSCVTINNELQNQLSCLLHTIIEKYCRA